MGWDKFKREGSDGRAMCQLDERKFWQSRMTVNGVVPKLPDLIDLEVLAKQVRMN